MAHGDYLGPCGDAACEGTTRALLLETEPVSGNKALSLEAFPNPFVDKMQLRIDLPASGKINLSVFNLQGQRVSVLANEVLDAGVHQLEWDGRSDSGRALPAGVYFARLQAESGEARLQLVLTR